ncbi:MAG: type II CAAX endopeptidase family protein [Armatimonadota bacterium]
MDVQPLEFDLSPSQTDPPLPRMPWVWFVFAIFFVAFIGSSLTFFDSKNPVADADKIKETSIELKLCMKSVNPDTKADRTLHIFDDQIDKLLVPSKHSVQAQKLRVVLRLEDNETPFQDDLKKLAKSSDPKNQAFAKLFLEPKPKKAEALALVEQIGKKDLSDRIAAVQIKEQFGDKSIRSTTFPPDKALWPSLVGVAGVIGLGIGMVLWYIYFFQRQAGRLLPKGIPFVATDWGKIDRLMFIGLIIFMSYFIAGTGEALIAKKNGSGVELLAYLPFFGVIALCFTFPVFGWRITAKDVGLSFDKFGEKLGWTFATFFANLPILLGMVMISGLLTKILPGGGHPAAEELLNHPKTMEIVKILIGACVIAPIWEEIFFRGILFPSFIKAFGRPLQAALLSSFIFASIHPQGMAGIPVLMGIGLMLCAVSYQTKSLVSNIMLHSLHNGATLMIALVLGPLIG